MAAGAPRKPQNVKKAQGTYRADRDLPDSMENYVKKIKEVPLPPEGMHESAHKYWYSVCLELIDLGVMADTDALIIKSLCMRMQHQDECYEILNEDGMFATMTNVKGHTYKMQHPAVNVMSTLAADIAKFCSMLGLSPESRSKIGIVKKNKKDPLSGFLNS